MDVKRHSRKRTTSVTNVTGEKLWLDRGSNPRSFANRANTLPLSYRATRSYHQQSSTWTLPRLHTSPGSSNSSSNFLWGNPRISYILLRRTYRLNRFSTVFFYVGGEKMWLDRGSNPGSFADRANTLPLSYQATRSYHQQLFTLTLPVTHFPGHFKFVHRFPVLGISNVIFIAKKKIAVTKDVIRMNHR